MSGQTKDKKQMSMLIGAAFLMATSAIGPGFLTQTANFTEIHGADFGFVILVSLLLSVGVQLNVWRVIGVSGMRGQDIANEILPGLGYIVAFLVAAGGLAFNIGNVGGAALGLQSMVGLDLQFGYIICGILAILVFLSNKASNLIDRLVQVLGVLMIIVILVVAVMTKPPLGAAIAQTFIPKGEIKGLLYPIITLLGGTVGGYITFAGGHRLVDGGITGEKNLKQITNSSIMGIGIAAMMRVFLFLAVLGVVTTGVSLDPANPAASAFRYGAGAMGERFFGLVLWAAAITSIIGAAYTSVSFLKTLSTTIMKHEKYVIIAFIAASTIIMTFLGSPAKLLVIVGSLNGLILPITMTVILIGSKKKSVVGDYQHPTWLIILGIVIVIASAWMGFSSLSNIKAAFA